MSKKTTNVVFIGAGNLSTTFHYPSLAEMKDVKIKAVCDLIPEKAKANAETFGIPSVYTDYKEMLEKESFDAVYIVMPPQDSFNLLQDCLTRGFHTFSEKPPCVTTFQTKALAAIAEKNGCITQLGFQRKHVPLLKKMRAMIAEKGPIDQFFTEFIKASPNAGLYYQGRIDILTCDAIHQVDTAVWLGGGTVPEVASVSRQSFVDQNVKFNALMQFESGTSGFFSGNWNSGRRDISVQIHGQNCCAIVDIENQGTYYDPENSDGIVVTAEEAAGSDKPYRKLGFFDEGREFIDAVKAGDPALTQSSFQKSVATMETVERILANTMG
ncbi:MAG: Gfo/Idh/MocA family oxidoreductase [Lentisphaeria bacterium]|nr:Gfo/Idh/MocA family oxidoreductase [Lentisphaeria bacterium]